MKIGERGQVTIPKEIRERYGLTPHSEVQFEITRDHLILKKRAKKLKLEKWRGSCKKSLDQLGFRAVDNFIENIRGR